MELYIIAIIIIVFLFSLGSLLFISKLPKGKTFDEMLAEKKQLKQLMLAASVQAQSSNTKGGKKTGGGGGKNQKKQKPLKGKAAQKAQESENSTESDSDDSSEASFNDMEYIETEQFNLLRQQKKQSKNQPPKKAPAGGKAKSGILTNKTETSPVVATNDVVVAEINHFEQIQPKDALALKNDKEDIEKEAKLQAKNVKDVKKSE
jgi:ribosome-binding protein 1